jgi:hypothetical protein
MLNRDPHCGSSSAKPKDEELKKGLQDIFINLINNKIQWKTLTLWKFLS